MRRWERIFIGDEETDYQVSDDGLVRNSYTKLIRKPFIGQTGYYRIQLSFHGHPITFGVHRLVAQYFCPIAKEYLDQGLTYKDLVPDHKDMNKLNNHYTNLEWVTRKVNTNRAFDAFVGPVGEKSHLAKMTDDMARKCCELLQQGLPSGEVAEIVGVSKKTVVHIKAGECWTRISKDYTFPKDPKFQKRMDERTIRNICTLILAGTRTDKSIAEQFGVSREHVRDIRLGKRCVDISKDYFEPMPKKK
nr:MAG TPA: homing endonuclease [Caudoviricetes sp.]